MPVYCAVALVQPQLRAASLLQGQQQLLSARWLSAVAEGQQCSWLGMVI